MKTAKAFETTQYALFSMVIGALLTASCSPRATATRAMSTVEGGADSHDTLGRSVITSTGGAYAEGLKFISTYIVSSSAGQDFLPEFQGKLSAFHVRVDQFPGYASRLRAQEAILDVGDPLFVIGGWNRPGSLRTDYKERVREIKRTTEGYRDRIRAFYLIDEPTSWGISRTDLELAIAELKSQMPGIPTFVVYAQDCFDDSSARDSYCGLAGRRGLPANADMIGFDWYLGTNPDLDAQEFQEKIINTVEKLKRMTGKPIVLIPDGTDQFLLNFQPAFRDQHIERRWRLFHDYAKREPQVIGLDNYAWANHDEYLSVWGRSVYVSGIRQWPASKATLFALAAPYAATAVLAPEPTCSISAKNGFLNANGSVAVEAELSWQIANAQNADYTCTVGSTAVSGSLSGAELNATKKYREPISCRLTSIVKQDGLRVAPASCEGAVAMTRMPTCSVVAMDGALSANGAEVRQATLSWRVENADSATYQCQMGTYVEKGQLRGSQLVQTKSYDQAITCSITRADQADGRSTVLSGCSATATMARQSLPTPTPTRTPTPNPTPTPSPTQVAAPTCSLRAQDGTINGDGSIAQAGQLSWRITNAVSADYKCTQGSYVENKTISGASLISSTEFRATTSCQVTSILGLDGKRTAPPFCGALVTMRKSPPRMNLVP